MAKVLNETETSVRNPLPREEHGNATMQWYLRNKKLVLDFLHSYLNSHLLQYHWNKFHLLKRCYFYLRIEPEHLYVRDQNGIMICTNIWRIANPCRLQKIKKLAKNQAEIQLALLSELLEQLERGRKELSHYVESCDMATFLSQWNWIVRRVLKLSMLVSKLISLEEPRKLYVKHSLVSQVFLGGDAHPQFSVHTYIKKPPVFDRRESFTSHNSAKLKWVNDNKESHLEGWQLEIRLVTNDSQTKPGYSHIEEVFSNSCIIHQLQPNRLYEFRIKRCNNQALVYSQWHDCIILKTKPIPAEDTSGSSSMSCLPTISYLH
ncbi:fibronectin type III domain-containing protein 11 [Pithys albifrons albifrons]|uniref:fibronectin type III domain-containing protein 11 n=1 Tax=Pithys albifrons albifrons TaxID=3385563 RepID=UPI003A5CB544